MRYCVGSKRRSENVLEEIQIAHDLVPPIMTMAAMATPIWLPMPPAPRSRGWSRFKEVKDSGEMKPCRAAKNEPAKPANIAPMAKAVSLVLVVLMPSERHGDLVFALRLPGAADRQSAQAHGDEAGEQRQRRSGNKGR